VSLTHRKSRKS